MAGFLLDANLSSRLVPDLAGMFPETTHVRTIGLSRVSDAEIWTYARGSGLTILSKDADFRHMSLILGAPPKFVWLRVGNCTTDQAAAAVIAAGQRILEFLADSTATMLVVER
ncbi:MAG: DUF5615 family PIN-like protein [Bauldia sp.]|nr:DUF5615 family PIN-like protein [Bauldia sp.]